MLPFSRLAASALFLTSGTLHFARPALFRAIVPAGFPDPAALVAISGAAEIAGALGLCLPATRRYAAFGLMALLLAVFPANVYMVSAYERFTSVAPLWLLVARLPLQGLLIAWMWSVRG